MKRTVLSRISNRFDLHLSSILRITNNLSEAVYVRSNLPALTQVLHIPARQQRWVPLQWLFPIEFFRKNPHHSEAATHTALKAIQRDDEILSQKAAAGLGGVLSGRGGGRGSSGRSTPRNASHVSAPTAGSADAPGLPGFEEALRKTQAVADALRRVGNAFLLDDDSDEDDEPFLASNRKGFVRRWCCQNCVGKTKAPTAAHDITAADGAGAGGAGGSGSGVSAQPSSKLVNNRVTKFDPIALRRNRYGELANQDDEEYNLDVENMDTTLGREFSVADSEQLPANLKGFSVGQTLRPGVVAASPTSTEGSPLMNSPSQRDPMRSGGGNRHQSGSCCVCGRPRACGGGGVRKKKREDAKLPAPLLVGLQRFIGEEADLEDLHTVRELKRAGKLKRFIPDSIWKQVYHYANTDAESYHDMEGQTIHFGAPGEGGVTSDHSSINPMSSTSPLSLSAALAGGGKQASDAIIGSVGAAKTGAKQGEPLDVAVSVAATSVNLSSTQEALSFDILLDPTIQICNRLCAPLRMEAEGARYSEQHAADVQAVERIAARNAAASSQPHVQPQYSFSSSSRTGAQPSVFGRGRVNDDPSPSSNAVVIGQEDDGNNLPAKLDDSNPPSTPDVRLPPLIADSASFTGSPAPGDCGPTTGATAPPSMSIPKLARRASGLISDYTVKLLASKVEKKERLNRKAVLPPGENESLPHAPLSLMFEFDQGADGTVFRTVFPVVVDYSARAKSSGADMKKSFHLHFRDVDKEAESAGFGAFDGDDAEDGEKMTMKMFDAQRNRKKSALGRLFGSCASRSGASKKPGERYADDDDGRRNSTYITLLYSIENVADRRLPNQLASDVFFWPSPILQISVFASYWIVNRRSDLEFFVGHRTPELDSQRPAYLVPPNSRAILSETHVLKMGEIEIGVTNKFITMADQAPKPFVGGGGAAGRPRPGAGGGAGILAGRLPNLSPPGAAPPIGLFVGGGNSSLWHISHPFPVKQVTQGGLVIVPKDMMRNPIQRVFGYSVRSAPFPFYRTLVIEMVRAVTLVNRKRHPIWLRARQEAGFQLLQPNSIAQWDPQSEALMRELMHARKRGKPVDEKRIIEHVQLRITGDKDSNYSGEFNILDHECFQLTTALAEDQLQNASTRIITKRDVPPKFSQLSAEGGAGVGDSAGFGSTTSTPPRPQPHLCITVVEVLQSANQSASIVVRFTEPQVPDYRIANFSPHPLSLTQMHKKKLSKELMGILTNPLAATQNLTKADVANVLRDFRREAFEKADPLEATIILERLQKMNFAWSVPQQGSSGEQLLRLDVLVGGTKTDALAQERSESVTTAASSIQTQTTVDFQEQIEGLDFGAVFDIGAVQTHPQKLIAPRRLPRLPDDSTASVAVGDWAAFQRTAGGLVQGVARDLRVRTQGAIGSGIATAKAVGDRAKGFADKTLNDGKSLLMVGSATQDFGNNMSATRERLVKAPGVVFNTAKKVIGVGGRESSADAEDEQPERVTVQELPGADDGLGVENVDVDFVEQSSSAGGAGEKQNDDYDSKRDMERATKSVNFREGSHQMPGEPNGPSIDGATIKTGPVLDSRAMFAGVLDPRESPNLSDRASTGRSPHLPEGEAGGHGTSKELVNPLDRIAELSEEPQAAGAATARGGDSTGASRQELLDHQQDHAQLPPAPQPANRHRHQIREKMLHYRGKSKSRREVTHVLREEEYLVTTLVNGGTREVFVYPWLLFRNFKNEDLFVSPGLPHWKDHSASSGGKKSAGGGRKERRGLGVLSFLEGGARGAGSAAAAAGGAAMSGLGRLRGEGESAQPQIEEVGDGAAPPPGQEIIESSSATSDNETSSSATDDSSASDVEDSDAEAAGTRAVAEDAEQHDSTAELRGASVATSSAALGVLSPMGNSPRGSRATLSQSSRASRSPVSTVSEKKKMERETEANRKRLARIHDRMVVQPAQGSRQQGRLAVPAPSRSVKQKIAQKTGGKTPGSSGGAAATGQKSSSRTLRPQQQPAEAGGAVPAPSPNKTKSHRRVLHADWVEPNEAVPFPTMRSVEGNIGMALSFSHVGDIYRENRTVWSYPVVIPFKPERSFFRRTVPDVMAHPSTGTLNRYSLNYWPWSGPEREAERGRHSQGAAGHGHHHKNKSNIYLQKSYVFRHPNCPLPENVECRSPSEWDITKISLSYDQRLECWVLDAVDAVVEAPFWFENCSDRTLYVKEMFPRDHGRKRISDRKGIIGGDYGHHDDTDLQGRASAGSSGLLGLTSGLTRIAGTVAETVGDGLSTLNPFGGFGDSRANEAAGTASAGLNPNPAASGGVAVQKVPTERRQAAYDSATSGAEESAIQARQDQVTKLIRSGARDAPVNKTGGGAFGVGGKLGAPSSATSSARLPASNSASAQAQQRLCWHDAPRGTMLQHSKDARHDPVPFAFHRPHYVKDSQTYQAFVDSDGAPPPTNPPMSNTTAAATTGHLTVQFQDLDTQEWHAVNVSLMYYHRDRVIHTDSKGQLLCTIMKTPVDRARAHVKVAARMANVGSVKYEQALRATEERKKRVSTANGEAPVLRSGVPAPRMSRKEIFSESGSSSAVRIKRASTTDGTGARGLGGDPNHTNSGPRRAKAGTSLSPTRATRGLAPGAANSRPHDHHQQHQHAAYPTLYNRTVIFRYVPHSRKRTRASAKHHHQTGHGRGGDAIANAASDMVAQARSNLKTPRVKPSTHWDLARSVMPMKFPKRQNTFGALGLGSTGTSVFGIGNGGLGGAGPTSPSQQPIDLDAEDGSPTQPKRNSKTGALFNQVRNRLTSLGGTRAPRTGFVSLQNTTTAVAGGRPTALSVLPGSAMIAGAAPFGASLAKRGATTLFSKSRLSGGAKFKQMAQKAAMAAKMRAPTQILEHFVFVSKDKTKRLRYEHALDDLVLQARHDETFRGFFAHLDGQHLKQIIVVAGLGISMNDSTPQEIGYLCIDRIRIENRKYLQGLPIGPGGGPQPQPALTAAGRGPADQPQLPQETSAEILAQDPRRSYPQGCINWGVSIGALQFDTQYGGIKRNVICVRTPILQEAEAASRHWLQNNVRKYRARAHQRALEAAESAKRKATAKKEVLGSGAKRASTSSPASSPQPKNPAGGAALAAGASQSPRSDPRKTVIAYERSNSSPLKSPVSRVSGSPNLPRQPIARAGARLSTGVASGPNLPLAASGKAASSDSTHHENQHHHGKRRNSASNRNLLSDAVGVLTSDYNPLVKLASTLAPLLPGQNHRDADTRWIKQLARKSGDLLTLVAVMKYQGSIVCLEAFQVHTNRLIIDIDSGSMYSILRFGAGLAQSISTDFLAPVNNNAMLSVNNAASSSSSGASGGAAGGAVGAASSIGGARAATGSQVDGGAASGLGGGSAGARDPMLCEPDVGLSDETTMKSSFPTPLFITKFFISKIKLVISVRFSSADETRGVATYNETELMRAYESLAKSLFVVDIQDTPLALGMLTGARISHIELEDKFLTKGQEDLTAKIGSSILSSLLFQSVMVLGTTSLFNPLQILRAVSNAFYVTFMSFSAIRDVVFSRDLPAYAKLRGVFVHVWQMTRQNVALFFLVWRAANNSVNGFYIAVWKICTRLCLGTRVRLPVALTHNSDSVYATVRAAWKFSVFWFLFRTVDAWVDSLERKRYGRHSSWLYFLLTVFLILPKLVIAVFAGGLLTTTKLLTALELALGHVVSFIAPIIGRLISDPPDEVRHLNCFRGNQLQNYDSMANAALEVVRKYCKDVDRRFWTACALSKATFVVLESGAMFYCRRHGLLKGQRVSDGSHNWVATRSGGSGGTTSGVVTRAATATARILTNHPEGAGAGGDQNAVGAGGSASSRAAEGGTSVVDVANARTSGPATGLPHELDASAGDETMTSRRQRMKRDHRRQKTKTRYLLNQCVPSLYTCCGLRRNHRREGTEVVWRLPESFRVKKVSLLHREPTVVVFEGIDLRKNGARGWRHLNCDTIQDALLVFGQAQEHLQVSA